MLIRARNRGFSLFEFAVVAVVLGIISAVLLNRLSFYQEAAEKASMQYTISSIKSALRSRMAKLLVEGRAQEYVLLANENPLDWLDVKPSGYLGALRSPASSDIPPGSWYFDSSDRTVVYRLKHGEHFVSSDGKQEVRLSVVARPNFAVTDLPPTSTSRSTDGVVIQVLTSYQWMQ